MQSKARVYLCFLFVILIHVREMQENAHLTTRQGQQHKELPHICFSQWNGLLMEISAHSSSCGCNEVRHRLHPCILAYSKGQKDSEVKSLIALWAAESVWWPSVLQLSQPVLPALSMLRPHSLSRFHGSDVQVGVPDGALFQLGRKGRLEQNFFFFFGVFFTSSPIFYQHIQKGKQLILV